MSKLNVGLIGFGTWAREAYLPALQHDGRVNVTAMTASSEKTKQLAREMLGDVTIFDSYEELLKHPNLDAVMVAVPDHVHQSALTAALESGIPVFYEPPIANSREQIQVMINRLSSASQVTFAHLELAFHPGVDYAIQLIKSGTIGLLHNASVSLNANWGCSGNSDICLMNRMACWYVDLLNKIVGSTPNRVLVLDGYGNSGRMQSISTGIYDYNGIWGMFKANVSSPEETSIIIEINGDKGDIYINYFTGEFRYRKTLHPEWICENVPALQPYANWPAVRETITAFLDAVITGEKSKGNIESVEQLNWVGLASEESIDTRTWASIKI